MRGMTEFGLYCAIKSCEATADRHQRGGRPHAAAAAGRRASRYRKELARRLEGVLARVARVSPQGQAA